MNNSYSINNGYYENRSENLYNGIYIPNTFQKRILHHIILNCANNINGFNPPLFLAIQGAKGEGKTFMLNALCNYYNIDTTIISGSSLAGQNEGDSIEKLKNEYENACMRTSRTRKISVIIIEDFHLSIASFHNTNISITSNSNILTSYLMNLADNPFINKRRVPIIFTGNDFTHIYPALTRGGRMDFFNWIPETDEKVNIVYFMYKRFYPNIVFGEVHDFVVAYEKKYIAFFNAVLRDMFFNHFDNVIKEFHKKHGVINLDEINSLISNGIFVDTDINYRKMLDFARNRDLCIASCFEA